MQIHEKKYLKTLLRDENLKENEKLFCKKV